MTTIEQPHRPSSGGPIRNLQQQQPHHVHPNLDGTYAQVKVFATPVSLPRPGSAPSNTSGNNQRQQQITSYQIHNNHHAVKNGIAARSGWGGVRTPNVVSTAAFRQSSSTSTSPKNPISSLVNRPQSAGGVSSNQSRQQMKGQNHREHWTHNESPGRAAADAAKEFHDIYSGQSRDEARKSRSPVSTTSQQQQQQQALPPNHEAYYRQYDHQGARPSIPDAHIQIKMSGSSSASSMSRFPVRGKAILGSSSTQQQQQQDNRPSSAHSNSSSARNGDSGRKSSPNNTNNAFPSRKIITAELTALRRKYYQANEANEKIQASNDFSNNRNHGAMGRGRRGGAGNEIISDPKKIRSQLDNIMFKINNNGGSHEEDQKNGPSIVDLGSGTTTNTNSHVKNHHYQTSSSTRLHHQHHHAPVPAHIQHDNILKRTSETAKVMRREDQVAKENDRRIRNFRARALVQSVTEMQKAKQDSELKEIGDKLIWAKMKRDAVDQELYELKMRLASLS